MRGGIAADRGLKATLANYIPESSYAGSFDVGDGNLLRLYVSPYLSFTNPELQAWADTVGGLLHGAEVKYLRLYFGPLYEVQFMCGSMDTLACYSPTTRELFLPDDLPGSTGMTTAEVLAHEYAHHLANYRSNYPWKAEDFGTKRWATALSVCQRTRSGLFHPGNEGSYYSTNPGEGFAEAYRVTNGWPVSHWFAVSTIFKPSAAAMAAVTSDATSPWPGQRLRVISTTLGGSVKLRAYAIAIPQDGRLGVAVRNAPPGSSIRIAKRVTMTTLGRSRTGASIPTVNLNLCGYRSVWVRVGTTSGSKRTVSVRIQTPAP